MEKSISFRTVAEAKLVNLDDRLRRIEQILDRLQLSLLQKMGNYVNDVSDIRIEMEETQKSFKKLLPELKRVFPEGKRTRRESSGGIP